ncbi:MAG: diacylglycerol kinase family lipid kinase [Acidobacteriota bacterium]
MKVWAILNPRAGVAPAAARRDVERGRDSWSDYAVHLTREPGHATELAREAVDAQADLVIAVGGDGTVNEVAQGLMGSGAALGIVPVGSGNGLARALRLPLRPARALAALDGGVRRSIDVGRLNGGLFLNVAGTGFDAAVGAAFQRAGGRGGRRGLLSYLRLSLGEVLGYRPQPLVLEANAELRSFKPLMITFANGPQYGSGAVINPGGRLDDGRLEVVSFDYGRPILDILRAAPRLFLGGLERTARYRRLSTARAVVTAESPLQIHRDGDPVEAALRIDVDLVPRALDVIVPAATVADPNGPFSSS